MANADFRYRTMVANAIGDEQTRLITLSNAAAQAVGAVSMIGHCVPIEQDAVLAIARARVTAQQSLIAALQQL
jgi:hypothetical protein